MAIRLLLVGNRSMFADGMRVLLADVDDFVIVGESAYSLDAIDHAASHLHPSVILVDASSAQNNGLTVACDVASRQRDRFPGVVTLGDVHRPQDVARAASAGIRGYVGKDDETATLISAIRAVGTGDAWLSPPAARHLLNQYRGRPAREPSTASRAADPLSNRERGVLRLIAYGHSNAEIARTLVLREATVKTHVSRILGKLGLRDRTQLAAFAYRNGLA